MNSPLWDGFFPRAVYGGIAFWLNLAILFYPMCGSTDLKFIKDNSSLLILVFVIVVWLTGYMIEQICFFTMKTFTSPVKWYYNSTVEIITNKLRNKTSYHEDHIKNSHKIITPEDAEIRFDEQIDSGWRNRFTIALINTQIAFAIFLSDFLASRIVFSTKNYHIAVLFLFFVIIPLATHLFLTIRHKWLYRGKEFCVRGFTECIYIRQMCWLMLNCTFMFLIFWGIYGILAVYYPTFLTELIKNFFAFQSIDVMISATNKIHGYVRFVFIFEIALVIILIYEANSICRLYGMYLERRGDPKKKND